MSDVPAPAPSAAPVVETLADRAKPEAKLPLPNSKHVAPKPPADPAKPPEPTLEEKKEVARRKYKMKVDGQEREEELSDDEITIRLQKAHAAEKRMQDAAEIKKAARQFVDDLRKDPWGVLSSPEIGLNMEELAEQRLAEKYRAELMTEEQRKAYELEKQIEKYKKQEQGRKDTEAANRRQALEKQEYEKIHQRYVNSAKKHGLPMDMRTLSLMAEVDLVNHEYGIELTDDQLAAEVNARFEQPLSTIKTLKGSDLLAKLGEDIVSEVLKAKVAEFKSKQVVPQPPPAKPAPKADGDSVLDRHRDSLSEWRKWRRS